MSDIRLPALALHANYVLPTSAKDFEICGLRNFRSGCYNGVRFIDVTGQEWLIESVEIAGYANWIQHLWWRDDYKSIKVNFELVKGREYSLEELILEIQEFLLSRKLTGQPFPHKDKDVPEYLARFGSIAELVSGIGYFDARQ